MQRGTITGIGTTRRAGTQIGTINNRDSPRGCSSLNDFPATMIEIYCFCERNSIQLLLASAVGFSLCV
jgi:hypothetical protein